MRRPLKIKDCYFDSFDEVVNVFITELVDYLGMTADDIKELFLNDVEWNYAERWVAPIIYKIKERIPSDRSDEVMTADQNQKLGKQIWLHFKDKWEGLDELWKEEYDPLYNYLDRYTETKTTTSEQTETGSDTLSGSDSVSHTKNTTTTRTDNLTETRNLSDEDVNRQKETTYGKSSTRTDNLTETQNLSETDNNRTKETTYGKSSTRTDDLTETRDLTDEDVDKKKETEYGKTNTRTDTEVREKDNQENVDNKTANYIAGYNSTGGTLTTGGVFSDRSEGNESHQNSKVIDKVTSGNVKDALSGTDTETFSGSTTHSGTIDHTGTEKTALSGKDTEVSSGSTSNTGTISNTGTETTALSGKDTEVNSGKTTHTGTIGNSGTQATQVLGTDTDSTQYGKISSKSNQIEGEIGVEKTSEHMGNIGNIYTQDMFKKEQEKWRKTFYMTILEDIVGYISLSVY
ncbi:MAG: hypothetical protein J6Q48_07790 [Bacteroidaceae bacterium]|nr:hypothetical protein [Bacteroidaceae bacterium]